MTAYVDDVEHEFGKKLMCHLWADKLDELLAMVDRIGVQRKWIQGYPEMSFGKHRKASWVHFDIAKGKRAVAIKAGAIETDRYGPIHWQAQRAGDTDKVEQIERIRAREDDRQMTLFTGDAP